MTAPTAPDRPVTLTIAGSDSGGGAGIQADLKTFHRFGVFGTSAITLVTAQNTVGVQALHMLPADVVVQQIASVATDFDVAAAKTGALGSPELIEAVVDALSDYPIPNLVVDPVMISKHGAALIAPAAVEVLRKKLFPLATVITPNLSEAQVLLRRPVTNLAEMEDAARDLRDLGPKAVLLKGGHLSGDAIDVFFTGDELVHLSAKRIETRQTHGTGCTLSAAIAALLAQGRSLSEAATEAKAFMGRALRTAPGLGHGYGPVNHWA